MKYLVNVDAGTYDIEVYCENTMEGQEETYIGSLIIDTKRGKYYIVPSEDYSTEQSKKYFQLEMIDKFLLRLCERINTDAMYGEVKSYSKEILNKMIEEKVITTKELEGQKEYEEILNAYNNNTIVPGKDNATNRRNKELGVEECVYRMIG